MKKNKGLIISAAILASCITINIYSFKKLTSAPTNPTQIVTIDNLVEQMIFIRDSAQNIDYAINSLTYEPETKTEIHPKSAIINLDDSIEKLSSLNNKSGEFYFSYELQDIISKISEVKDSLPNVNDLTEYEGKPINNDTFKQQRNTLESCVHQLSDISDTKQQEYTGYFEDIKRPYTVLTISSSIGIAFSIGLFSHYMMKLHSQIKEENFFKK